MKYRAQAVILAVTVGLCVVISVARGANITTKLVVTVIPNAPTSLSASASSESQIDLSWTDNANNETGFSVERSLNDDLHFATVATTSPDVTVFHDAGLTASTLYYYRVLALGAAGNSGYTNEASTTTSDAPLPPPSSSGGGGGGGGGGGSVEPPLFQTSAVFRGIAYPSSNVTLLQNAQVVAVTQAGPDAKFEIDLSALAPGTYNFGVWAQDPQGNRSITQTFSVTLTTGATTVISGIFFAPTISLDKTQIRQGEILNVLGYSAPSATISLIVNSTEEIKANVSSTGDGAWFYKLNTSNLEYGDHTVRANAQTSDGDITTDSDLVTFTVGNEDVQAIKPVGCPAGGDLNDDCSVNLVDFSVMAYWYQRGTPPAAIDLNHDGVINLVDFSILAYYWTG